MQQMQLKLHANKYENQSTCGHVHFGLKGNFLRLQVEHQGGILQTNWIAADGIVDCVAGGECWSTPVQKDGGRTVGFSIHVVWRRWRGYQAISNSWEVHLD